MSQHHTKNPVLSWLDGQPYAEIFQDIYFSQQGGLAESEYVFLAQNQLAERWQTQPQDYFCIVETGFGTGLNFLAACRLWLNSSTAHQRLHYVACEKYPLSLAQLQQAQQMWPELAALSEELCAQYGHLGHGFHRWQLFQQRVVFSLFVGDIADFSQQFYGYADAWFLDGFAPAKNPDMWQANLFQLMARQSNAGASFATFTSAGVVKRGLQSAGFVVNKQAGYGKKREMLRGYLASPTARRAIPSCPARPSARPIHVAIIGAGLSGLLTAEALARRGYHCTLIEQLSGAAQGASGNDLGVLYPRPNEGDNPLNQLAIASYQYSLPFLQHLIASLPQASALMQLCGVLQVAQDAAQAQRLRNIAQQAPPWLQYVDAEQASQIAGVALSQAALYFPSAGWLNPKLFCLALLERLSQQYGVNSLFHQQVLRLQAVHQASADGWQIFAGDQCLLQADIVILANTYQIQQISQTAHCKLTPVKGQTSQLPSNPDLQKLNCMLCGDAYLSPAIDLPHSQGQHILGATFEPNITELSVTPDGHQHNLNTLAKILPQIVANLALTEADLSQLSGRAAIRSSSPDYLPLLGAILDTEHMPSALALQRDPSHPLPFHRGLYVHAGHGAKGILQAPLCAEILACQITGEPMPVSQQLLAALNPNRFWLKQHAFKKQRQQYLDPLLYLNHDAYLKQSS